jgi:hypothetical protein
MHRPFTWTPAYCYASLCGQHHLHPSHKCVRFLNAQALHEDPRMLLALMDHAPPGAFTRLAAADGTTPFHLAFQVCPPSQNLVQVGPNLAQVSPNLVQVSPPSHLAFQAGPPGPNLVQVRPNLVQVNPKPSSGWSAVQGPRHQSCSELPFPGRHCVNARKEWVLAPAAVLGCGHQCLRVGTCTSAWGWAPVLGCWHLQQCLGVGTSAWVLAPTPVLACVHPSHLSWQLQRLYAG